MSASTEPDGVKAADADPVTVRLPDNRFTRHVLSPFGCIQMIELLSLVTALICSLLNHIWLVEGGGAYVCAAIILALIFTLISFSFRVGKVWNHRPKWQLAEWLCYLIILLLLIVAVAINIRACYLVYMDMDIYGRVMLIHNDHVIGTAVFLFVCTLGYLVHFLWLTTNRYKAVAAHKK